MVEDAKKREAQEKQAAAAQKKPSSDQIERPIKTKQIKGKTSFVCAGTTFVVDDKYEYIKQIGHGAYGVVCSAYDHKLKNKVAIKKVPKAFEDLIDAKRIVREIKLLKFFDHENVIAMVDVQKPPAPTGYEDIYIVTDLMETDMHRVIYSRQDLTDDHLQYFMYQLLRGCLYIHSANIIHRDLKPSNLLLNKNCDLKVCDFGLARGYEETTTTLTEYVVTRWYRAPEVILNASHYSNALDVWSIGCIFAELLGRAPLFPGDDYLDQIKRTIAVLGTPTPEDMTFIGNDLARKYIRKLPKRNKQSWSSLYPKANPVALNLLGKMLVFNPEKRYTVKQCLKHPYFEGLHNEEAEPECEEPFDWTWDDFEPTKEILQRMVYEESLEFHPDEEDESEQH
jgi:mitogen-activated protein kinase 1/3